MPAKSLRRWLAEPLLQLRLTGFPLFGLDALVSQDPAPPGPEDGVPGRGRGGGAGADGERVAGFLP